MSLLRGLLGLKNAVTSSKHSRGLKTTITAARWTGMSIRLLMRASWTVIRSKYKRFVFSILAWELSFYLLEQFAFWLRMKSATFLFGAKSDDAELLLFLEWLSGSPRHYAAIEKAQSNGSHQQLSVALDDALDAYETVRANARPGSRAIGRLNQIEDGLTQL